MMSIIKEVKEIDEIKPITEINDFRELHLIQRKVWGIDDIEVVPIHILKVISDKMSPNGIVLGYYMEGKIIGFILTFPTSNSKEVILHMLAVSTDYQRQGIGYKLMIKLREIMLGHDIEKIFWTYDPLESVNANLYIRKLGGIITQHYLNYYEQIGTGLNSDLPTDRFIVEWNIKNEHVKNKIESSGMENNSKSQLNSFDDGYVQRLVNIPHNIQELKRENISKANATRIETRTEFEDIITRSNYIGLDFVYDKDKLIGTYIFKKSFPNACNQ